LTVDFPSDLYTRDPVVEDYLPPNSTYVGTGTDGSTTTPANTVAIPSTVPSSPVAVSNSDAGATSNPVVKTTSDGDLLTWYLGSSISSSGNSSIYALPAQVFQYDIGTTITAAPSAYNTFDLTQNLMKFTSFNSPGEAVADRNDAPYTLDAPSLTLLKGVESDGPGTSSSGNTTVGGGFNSNKDGVTVTDGGNAVFRVDVSNWGLDPVYTPTIWDPLQSTQTCAEIPDISDSGTCYNPGDPAPTGIDGLSADVIDPTIVWNGPDIASIAAATSTTAPGELTLSYQFDIPSAAATGDVFNDEAGVVSYVAAPNTGPADDVTYYPQMNNIATSDGFTLPGSLAGSDTYSPTPPAGTVEEDPSKVLVKEPLIAKTVSPSSATIGQVVTYTITATSPAGGSLYDGVVTDPLGSRLTYDPDGAATATCVGGAVGGTDHPPLNGGTDTDGFTFSGASNTITLDWPDLVDSATAAVCTIVFDATVTDIAANYRGLTVPNSAKFAYKNESGGNGTGSPVTSNTVNVTVTEPDVALAKTDSDAGNPVPHQASPGATVTYTLTLLNPDVTNVSSASDLVVTDCVQNGPTYVPDSSTVTVPAILTGAQAEPVVATCSGSGTQLTWNLNTLYGHTVALAKGASATITYQTTLPALPVGNDTYPNSVTLTVSSLDTAASPGARTAASADAESIGGYSASGGDTVSVPGAMVTKIASPTSSPVGVDSTFTATVAIPADLSFPDLTAVDVLPDGMTFDSFGSASCQDTFTHASCGGDIADITTEAPTHDSATGLTSIGWWIGNVDTSTDTRVVTLTYTAYASQNYHGGGPVNPGDTLTNTIGSYWGDADASWTTDAPAPSLGPTFGFAHDSGTQAASVTVLAPSLSLGKSTTVSYPTPGATIPFTVQVVNGLTNSSTAFLTTVTDPIPSLLAVNPSSISAGGLLSGASSDGTGGTITWTLTGQTIAPGSSLSLLYDATLAPSDDFTTATETAAIKNTATVDTYYAVSNATAIGDTFRYDPYGSESGQASLNPVFPALSIAKYTGSTGTSLNGTTNIDQATSWHLAVTDTTAAAVQSLGVVDTLPPYWTYDPGSTSIGTEHLGTLTADPSIATNSTTHVEVLTWSGLGMLDDTYTDTVAYQATPGVGAQLDASGNTNRAYAIADDMTGSSGVGVGVGGTYSAYQSTTATANDTIPQADLSIAKTNGTPFVSGANGMYSIVVTNKGPDPAAEPITVSDVLPTGEGFVSASGTGWACANASGTVSCSSGSSGSTAATGLVAGTISLLVNVASSVTPGTGAITNTAKVSDTGPYDPVSSDNSSSDPTTVQGADLAIHKSHSGTFTAGQSGTYSLVVTNNGPADSAGPITVSDTLPAGETLASTPTGTGWICSNLASVVTCTHATAIADGTSAGTISLPVDIASSATGKIINTATVTPGPTDDPDSSNNSSSDQVTIATSADLNIEKTLTLPAGGLVSGQDATYTIKVNNLGPSDAVAPQVQDVLPAGESFVSASGTDWNCSNTNGTVGCTYTAATSLSDGASASPITLVVSVSSAAVSTITNTAIVCSGTIGTGSNLCTGSTYANGTLDPITENNTSSAPGTPAVSADLTIQKSHAGNFVSGANGTYSITVTDDGPADSVGTSGSPIVVSDTLPSGESYVSATGTGWTCTAASQIVTCDYASVIVADTSAPMISLVVAVSSSALGTVTNTVQVTPGVTADGNPANNSASDPTTIVGADLSITKTHSGSFTAGSEGTYTITVSNNGPATSAGPINVIDTLPTGESYVSANATGWTCSDGSGSSSATVTCTNPSSVLANAAMAPISLVVAIGVDVTDTLTNTAEVVPGPTADPVTSNNTTTDPTAVLTGADLAIHKSHSGTFILDEHGTYDLAVTNNGPAASGPITVSDTLPAGETFVSAGGSGWSCTSSTAGASSQPTVTCSLQARLGPDSAAPMISLVVDVGVGAYPSVTNTAKVSSPTTDPNLSNNSSSDTLSPTPVTGLRIEKTLRTALVSGTHALYSVVVTDSGPSPAAQVVVTDPMPSGLVPLSGTGPGWHCGIVAGTNEMRCTTATLGVDTPSTIMLAALVTAKAGDYLANTASVKSSTESIPNSRLTAESTTPGTKVQAGRGSPTPVSPKPPRPVSPKPPRPVSPKPPRPVSPKPPLAFTGFDLIPISVGGLLLILSGLATLEVVRRRRRLAGSRG
jgi:fimbrial isopeptide formation D2 family protein/uncharacterized repeat protein (TIGR01451 family)